MVVMNKEIKMLGNRHFNQIDIVEIKIFIGKKVGSQRAEKYFSLLDSFFSFKLGKSEFNKQCIAVIGRENIHLHNRLITSILKNTCLSNTHPRKRSKLERNIDNRVDINGYQKNCLQSLCRDAFPLSPRRGRKPGFGDRKSKGRPSPLGPNGKPNYFLVGEDLARKTLEQQSATVLLSLGSRPIEVTSVEDGEEVDQVALSPGIHSRSPITPPFGIPWNGKSKQKVLGSLLPSSGYLETCLGNGELPDTYSLRKRLGQKLEQQGLRISLDCVNLLNSGLDTFLKRLVKPSLELASSRSENKRLKKGCGPFHGPNGVWPVRYPQSTSPSIPSFVSFLDFWTSMEMNPQVLGEDWPIQIEKLCLGVFENVC